MKKTIFIVLSCFVFLLAYFPEAIAKRAGYVGTLGCKCHKSNIDDWNKTVHGHALDSLKLEGRNQKIRDILTKHKLDENKDYSTDKKCVSCHTTGYDERGGYDLDDPEEDLVGVGCEMCHGPGSEYRVIHKENELFKRSETMAAGELYPEKDPKGVCGKCHYNKEAPTFDPNVKFDFNEKIKEVKYWHKTNKLEFNHEDGVKAE